MKSTLLRDGSVVEVDVVQKDGVFLRATTYDEYVKKEIPKAYGWLETKDKRVLDVGANIGLFSVTCRDALQVVAVEPEPHNFKMLLLNTSEMLNVSCVRAALVSGDDKSVSLYNAPSGKNPGNTSTTPFRGRVKTEVPALNFRTTLEEYGIDTIKMDCEGAEFDLLSEPLPETVKQIAIEIHLGKREWRNSLAPKLISMFSDWECVVEPVITETNWMTLAGWRR